MNKSTLKFAGPILIVAVVGGFCWQRSGAAANPPGSVTQPVYIDASTRADWKHVTPADIRSLRFYGMNMGNFDPETPSSTLTETRIVSSFLNALKIATTNYKIRLGNGIDSMEVVPRAHAKNLHASVKVDFNAQATSMWYGPAFKKALDQLSDFKAAQVRKRLVLVSARDIRKIQLGKRVVTTAPRIKSLLGALQHVDRHAYAYTSRERKNRGQDFDTFQIFFRNGSTLSTNFVLYKSAPDAAVKALWDFYEIKN